MILTDIYNSHLMSERLELEHLMGSASSNKRRYLDTANSAADTKRTDTFRDTLASYRKQFTPMLFMETLQITDRKQPEQLSFGETEEIRTGPRKKLEYEETQEKQSKTELIQQLTQKNRNKPKENWDTLNTKNRILKLSSQVKQIKREVFQETMKEWKRPTNLEYQLRKKRFFQTFQRGSSHSQSYSNLARKFRLNY